MANKSKKEEKKTSLFGKIAGYFKGVRNEIKRIKWPTGSELVVSLAKVLVFVILFGIFFVLCDAIISGLLVLIGVGA